MRRADSDAPLPLLSVTAVKAAGRGLDVPFRLVLRVVRRLSGDAAGQPGVDEQALTVTVGEMLRLLPGRRLVARVEVGSRRCLLKLFLGRGASRYLHRELAGCALLEGAGVSTPRRLAEVAAPGGEGVGVLFEFLDGARTVEAGDEARVVAAAIALGRLHAVGAWQSDLHLDNFLYRESGPSEAAARPGDQGGAKPGDQRGAKRGNGLFVIDGDGVRGARRARPLEVEPSLANLAVLCAQRPPLLDARLPDLLRAYAGVREWPVAGASFDRLLVSLQKATRRERQRRVRRYLRKVQRACTEYHCERSLRRYFVCVRERLDDGLLAFQEDPEAAFQGAEMLKDGNSATVVRCRIGERSWVVKRYNVKGFWHGLRRILKPRSRFRLAWCNGQRLHFLDIPTARPVALLERRLGPLRGVAYLVMEDCGREDLLGLAAADRIAESHLDAVTRLFRSLAAAGLAHGDTKATNFLVAQDAVVLVDLDAMGERAAALAGDIRRFLANWNDNPALQQRFRERFAVAGLPLPA